MITRQTAEQILWKHGITPSDPRNWDPKAKTWDPISTFDHEVGIKTEYELMEVMGFLGYCCPHC